MDDESALTLTGAEVPPGGTAPSGPRRRSTIYDVAQEAGVAPSTVSRAFSDPGRVNVATRTHVLAVADRLDYRGNTSARALPAERSATIALLVPDITNPYFFGLIRGAEHQARAAGYLLIIVDTEESADLELRHLDRLSQSVDGFILAGSRLPNVQVAELCSRGAVALINRQLAQVPSVVVDNADGTAQIVEHLASLGHRRLAYLAGPRSSWADSQRWSALAEHATRLGLESVRLGPFPPARAAGAAAADAAIRDGATAVVAFNDLLAIGVLNRLAERGVAVPDQVSVVGYDDIFGSDFSSPPLTTLAAPIEDAGRSAVDLVIARLTAHPLERPRKSVVLPSCLRIRQSTGPVR